MLTKTGLRPREPRSSGNRSRPFSGLPEQNPPGIGKKLPPVVYSPYPNKWCGGALATARMIRARRQTTGTISNFPGGGTQIRPRGRNKTPAGGSGRSRSSGSRSRGRVEAGADRSRPACSRPEWDDSLGDPSRYKLTPEEAVQRKKSLVSKHNTLVFGLGGHGRDDDDSTPNAQMAATAAAAARVRSAKQIEQGAQRVVDEPRPSRRSRRASTAGVAELNPAGDLTVSGTEPEGTEVGEINDLTVTLYAARGSCEEEHREGLAGSAAAGGTVTTALVGGCKVDGERGGGNVSADDGANVSGLAGIEVGIKAFSEKVWRLETYRRAGLAGDASAVEQEGKEDENDTFEGGSRACNAKSDKENMAAEEEEEEEMSSRDERMTTAGEITTCNIYGGSPSSKHAGEVAAADLYHGEGATTLDDSDGRGAERRRRRRHNDSGRHRAGPWSPPSSETGEPSIAAAALSSTRDEREAVNLVERIQLLEAQILRLRLSPSSALTADSGEAHVKGAGDEDLGAAGVGETGAGGAGQPGAAVSSMEDMRVVIADLLSLTAALLKRATAAELRLRKLTAGGDRDGGGEVEKGRRANNRLDVQKAADLVAHRVRARAESVVLDYGRKVPFETLGGEREEEEEETAVIVATGVHSDGATVNAVGRDIPSSFPVDGARSRSSSSSFPLEAASLRVGRSPNRVGPLQRLRLAAAASASATASPSAKDCWGQALDAVGQLVDGDDENAPGILATPSEACSPHSLTNFREMETLPPLPRGVAAAASVATALSPVRVTRAYDSERPTGSFARRPPSPLRAAPVATRRWGARDVLAPLGTPRAPRDSAGGGVSVTPWDDGVASALLRTPGGGQENEDEDARSEPSFLAPTPAMKPQHPFERTPPMRSPRWLRGRVGGPGGETGGAAAAAAPAFTVGQGGREGASDESGRDKLRAVKAPPAIGQWYTPARSRGVAVG